jgi:hypothetical protein
MHSSSAKVFIPILQTLNCHVLIRVMLATAHRYAVKQLAASLSHHAAECLSWEQLHLKVAALS